MISLRAIQFTSLAICEKCSATLRVTNGSIENSKTHALFPICICLQDKKILKLYGYSLRGQRARFQRSDIDLGDPALLQNLGVLNFKLKV